MTERFEVRSGFGVFKGDEFVSWHGALSQHEAKDSAATLNAINGRARYSPAVYEELAASGLDGFASAFAEDNGIV